MTVQVCIPLAAPGSGDQRDRLHRWCVEGWIEYRDVIARDEDWVISWGTDHPVREVGEPPMTTDRFNHARAINTAVAGLQDGEPEDVLVIADADTFPDPLTLLDRIDAAREGLWTCPLRYVQLSPVTTERVLALKGFPAGAIEADSTLRHVWEGPTSWSGVVVIRRDQFDAVGGYDERFDGWSADDIAFAMSVETLVAPVTRLGTVFHLYHDAPRSQTYDRPGFSGAWDLTTRYMNAHRDVVATRALIGERSTDGT